MTKKQRDELRASIADLLAAVGCGCCGDQDERDQAEARIAKVLAVPRYKDGSGFNFYKFKAK